ncbi:unnamed protein product [Miscanthus lutarioriparius]|uniref:Uncharacterized protein n=1 Tax=Miscanthus lutarioriparius TaxID=422564 RepID=A0A811N1Q4_9POAL|nr:unnamed protein product [Miscanthus lutarioriparius]
MAPRRRRSLRARRRRQQGRSRLCSSDDLHLSWSRQQQQDGSPIPLVAATGIKIMWP